MFLRGVALETRSKMARKGCERYFPKHRCLLVNADCRSSDQTSEIFAATATRSEKVALKTSRPAQGKGAALKLIFEYMLEVDATHGICIDTDLTTVTPEWIRAYSLALSYDFTVPRYARHRCDATITNLLVYPLVCAVFGFDLRQPIGGDFGFSRRAAHAFLAQEWHPKVEKYGIDIFMTTSMLKKGFLVGEVELPPKIHSPTLPKLRGMLEDVAEVLLSQLEGHGFSTHFRPLPSVPWKHGDCAIPELKVDPGVLLEMAQKCFEEHRSCIESALATMLHAAALRQAMASEQLDGLTWTRLLRWALTTKSRNLVLPVVKSFFFLRAASHIQAVQSMSNAEAELRVAEQRDQLIGLCRAGEAAELP